MRPVRLELEGFTAFRDRTVVDFDGVDLFALSGPTGAGKTSVVDAITFALYGSVPRLDDRSVAPVISQRRVEARVRLDFTVGGDAVQRRAGRARRARPPRRRGSSAASTARSLADRARELDVAVEALLGLDFGQFTTCVSLPQGEFARFLHAEPRHRQDLLVRLLDLGLYDRVRELAGAAVGRRPTGAEPWPRASSASWPAPPPRPRRTPKQRVAAARRSCADDGRRGDAGDRRR